MIYVIVLALSLILTSVMIKIAKKLNIVDKPDNILKKHEKITPYLGGISILLSFSFFIDDNLYLLIFSFLIAIIGLVDDIKNISAKYRFIVEFIITFLIAYLIIDEISFLIALFLAFVGVSIINSFNMIDGMDGLSSGLALLSLVFFYYFLGSQFTLIIFFAIFGFYIFNYPPAKIFLGDSGSYLIGFLLYYQLLLMIKNFGNGGFFISLVILGFFLTDLVWAFIRRFINKGNIFDGDKDHIYDKARKYFKNDKKVLLIMYLINIVFGLFSLITWNFKYLGVIISLIVFLIIGRFFKLYSKT
ncbi:MAG: glycosyltransferase family 4 protein [Thermotogota bacterium]